jgi:hypothetical protein
MSLLKQGRLEEAIAHLKTALSSSLFPVKQFLTTYHYFFTTTQKSTLKIIDIPETKIIDTDKHQYIRHLRKIN